MAKERNVDIVFCFDGTGSMAPCLDNVKANARRFHQDLLQCFSLFYNVIVLCYFLNKKVVLLITKRLLFPYKIYLILKIY